MLIHGLCYIRISINASYRYEYHRPLLRVISWNFYCSKWQKTCFHSGDFLLFETLGSFNASVDSAESAFPDSFIIS
jgi:hypothetical protein